MGVVCCLFEFLQAVKAQSRFDACLYLLYL